MLQNLPRVRQPAGAYSMLFVRITLLAATAGLVLVASLSLAMQSPLDAALASWDMTEARELVLKLPDGPDHCAVEGLIASRENRLSEAEVLLSECLPELDRTRSPRARATLDALVDVYRRSGEYGREYALIERWLTDHSAAADPEAYADLRNELGIAAALRGLSHSRATGSPTALLQTYLNPLGTRNVDLTVSGVRLPWMIDTGANYSVVSERAARLMKLEIREAGYRVAGSTGHSVTTRIAVIATLPVGKVILHDVVAIVVPDESLHIRSSGADYQIDAALGYPALAQLGRLQIDPDGTFAIDRTGPLLRSGARLYMDQLTPLAEVEIANRNSLLSVDTGATRTTLYASYAARFGDRASSWTRTNVRLAGMGGNVQQDVMVEPRLAMVAGGHTLIEYDVSIAPEGDKSAPIVGNLGQTFLTANGSYTFDFRSMRLLLGRQPSTPRL